MIQPTLPNEVLARLPHRAPFRFVSEVHALEPARGAGVWVVSGDEAFLRGHFPDEPIVPGVLLVEALAQLAGLVWLCDAGNTAARARLAHVDVKFLSPVRPAARVELAVQLTRSMDHLGLFTVEATAGGERVAVGSLVLARATGTGAKS